MRYMKDVSYERPREKLEGYGVSTLSNAELIQVILGSGSAKVPIGKLARSVAQLLGSVEGSLDMQKLCTLPGIGAAKAAQVIAALELGSRSGRPGINAPILNYKHLLREVARAKQPRIALITLDGAGNYISLHAQRRRHSEHPSVIARRVAREAISDQAAACVIAVNARSADALPAMEDIQLAYECRSALATVSVRLIDFLKMTPTGAHSVVVNHLPKAEPA